MESLKKPHVLVSYSGGKDSQACMIWAAKKWGVRNVAAVFCDTGWEHPETYEHIKQTTSLLGVSLIILSSNKYKGMIDLAKKKGRFPSATRRFCTVELKVKPMVDYVLSLDNSCIIVQGIRAKESASRAKMLQECSYFKEYFEEGKGLYRPGDVRKWCEHYDASVFRPIFDWTSQQVIDYIINNNQQPNPLYRRGSSRVGCYPCVMSRLEEIKHLDEFGRIRLRFAEQQAESSFFAPNKIPRRYYGNRCCPSSEDVISYARRNDCEKSLFEETEENWSCMSLYHGLCE